MNVTIQLVKAFTRDASKGNPAGVLHSADHLSDAQMLHIARELGFSESAFIQKSAVADYRVRFFAARQEVDFCGHATVATFHSLVEAGRIVVGDGDVTTVTQETKAGVFPVACHADGKIMMAQGRPTFGGIEEDREDIAKLLGVTVDDLGDLPLQSVATAVEKLLIPMASREALRKVRPDFDGISRYTQAKSPTGFYLFTSESFSGNADFATRYFNPLIGINEDPATGVAAGPLACYADRYMFEGRKKTFVIEQGWDMGKDSTIYVDIESEDVLVGGYAASFGQSDVGGLSYSGV